MVVVVKIHANILALLGTSVRSTGTNVQQESLADSETEFVYIQYDMYN